MHDNYWKFIFALQYNANLFFKSHLDYTHIHHEWTTNLCDIFLVRDYEKNTLLYDSIDSLVIGLFQQNFKSCSLYPSNLIFNETDDLENTFFELNFDHCPVAVFNNINGTSLALIQIREKLKSPPIIPIGDPRDFWEPTSSQTYPTNFSYFSLITLNKTQQNECLTFDKNLIWDEFIEKIDQEIFKNPISQDISAYFECKNNLFCYMRDSKYSPLIDTSNSKPHIGLSLIESIKGIPLSIQSFCDPRNEHSEFRHYSEEEYIHFEHFKIAQKKLFNQLVCHTANSINQEIILNHKTESIIKKWKRRPTYTWENDHSITAAPMNTLADESISGLRVFFILIILSAAGFGIFYIFNFLFNQFEFIKFIIITLGCISLIYIVSKK